MTGECSWLGDEWLAAGGQRLRDGAMRERVGVWTGGWQEGAWSA